MKILTGQYWWVLVVRDCVGSGRAYIARVLRGKRSACVINVSFTGSLADCRHFQVANGGSADGVILVDDSTPIKLHTDGGAEFKRDDFEHVNSIDGGYAVVGLRRAIENIAGDVVKADFKILAHLPVLFFEVERIRQKSEAEVKAFVSFADGVSKIWTFAGDELIATLKICDASSKNMCDQLVNFVKECYFVKSMDVVETSVSDEAVAIAAAEDAWLFRTDHLPAFSTNPDETAVARVREAALFRTVFKACICVLLATLFVSLAFWGGVAWYASSTQVQIAAFEKNIETRKELEKVWKKLEKDRAGTETFLSHRSQVSSSLSRILAALPENVWVDHWTFSRNIHSLRGYALSSEDVSLFLSSLEADRSLVNVRLRTTEKTTYRRKPVVKFDLTAEAIR